jgi:hypothetical protein
MLAIASLPLNSGPWQEIRFGDKKYGAP